MHHNHRIVLLLLELGSKVKLRVDNGWDSPGCVTAYREEKVRVYWPDQNLSTEELPADLVAYGAYAIAD